jgi:HAD superfamily hydrolase (TIGR01484 family)
MRSTKSASSSSPERQRPRKSRALLPLKDLDPRGLSVIFADIDDTITTDGRLEPAAFKALWSLHEAELAVVPVTGRPAGWCDHFARMWPVSGVIGENGAFYFRYDQRRRHLDQHYLLSAKARARLQVRLQKVRDQILAQVPGSAVASDQPYRIHDLAIDFCEDVKRLPPASIDRIVALFQKAGATAKVSSIHVNGWFGDYDKLSMMKTFAWEILGLRLDEAKDRRRALYVGDSPNDEPAFAFFERAVGVANVRDFEDRLKHPPRYVTRARAGAGFAELARYLLRSRS